MVSGSVVFAVGWILFELPISFAVTWERRVEAARQVEEMYSHAFESYMAHAFPADELRPLSCDGRWTRERGDLDAVIGNYSMTLIDALGSLVIFGRLEDFKFAVQHISNNVTFDRDVQVISGGSGTLIGNGAAPSLTASFFLAGGFIGNGAQVLSRGWYIVVVHSSCSQFLGGSGTI